MRSKLEPKNATKKEATTAARMLPDLVHPRGVPMSWEREEAMVKARMDDKENQSTDTKIRIILFGPENSGKSTIRKLMRIKQYADSGDGDAQIFSDEEMSGFVKNIRKTIFEGLTFLIHAVDTGGGDEV